MIQLDYMLIRDFMPFVGEYRIDLANRGLVFIVGENTVSRMADSNGSGKTAIFDAICVALYDKLLRGLAPDRLINREADSAYLEVGFHVGATAYRSEWERGEKRRWELFEAETPIGSGQEIAGLFGLSYRAFIQTIMYGVSNLDSFAQQADTARKQLFDDLLDIAFFGQKRKQIEDEAKSVLEKLNLAQQELNEILTTLQTLATEQESIGAKRESVETEALRQWHARHDERTLLYGEINETFQRLLVAAQHVEHEQALVDDSIQLAALRNRIQSIFSRSSQGIFRLQREQEALKDLTQCEMCHRPLDHTSRAEVNAYFDAAIKPLQAECEMLVRYELLIENMLATWPATPSNENFALLRRKLDALHDRLSRETLPNQLDEARFLRQAVDEIEEREAQLRQKQVKLQNIVHEYQSSLTLREFWSEGFGHRGMKAILLADYEEFINERLLRYAHSLMAGEIQLRFKASRQLKSGTVRDEIEFEATNQHGSEIYDGLSAGEKQRVDLCLVLALQDLVRELHRGQFSLALYDEIFEHFDETGCQQVMEFLTTQRREYGSVFVISQNPKLLSYAADHVIRVVKTEKGSRIHVT